MVCPVCNENKINWVEKDNTYRRVCSARCRGKLTNERNPNRNKIAHPILSSKMEYIEYFGKNKIKIVERSIVKVYPDLVAKVNENIPFDLPFQERVYMYLNDLRERPKCKHCNHNQVDFTYFTKGYRDYCSVKCSSNSEDKKNAIISTCLDKYGVKNIGESTREKALKTMDERYGMHISKTDGYKEKFRKTSLERFGVEHPFMSGDVKDRIKKTNIERYGVENPNKSEDIVAKILQTKRENGIIYKWSEKEIQDIQLYKSAVRYYTERTYETYKSDINPDMLERGIHSNHIDHIFPVIKGWENDIDPKLMSHPKNLRMLSSSENRSKGDRSDMTIEYFYEMIGYNPNT